VSCFVNLDKDSKNVPVIWVIDAMTKMSFSTKLFVLFPESYPLDADTISSAPKN